MKAAPRTAASPDVTLQVKNWPLDKFKERHGYNYDYVFVFKVHDEESTLTEAQTMFSMRLILQRLAGAGLETKLFYSSSRDLVFCKVVSLLL